MASCENTIACERARPLDQANSKTCVLHAIANAVAEACMDRNLDLKLDELVGGLKQLHFVDVEGNRVEDFNGAGLKKMTDFNTEVFHLMKLKHAVAFFLQQRLPCYDKYLPICPAVCGV